MGHKNDRDQSAEDKYVAATAMEKSREYERNGDRRLADAYSELANWALDDMEKRGDINTAKKRK